MALDGATKQVASADDRNGSISAFRDDDHAWACDDLPARPGKAGSAGGLWLRAASSVRSPHARHGLGHDHRAFVSEAQGLPLTSVATRVLRSPSTAVNLLQAAFNPMDLLFYALATYEGYKLSRRRLPVASPTGQPPV